MLTAVTLLVRSSAKGGRWRRHGLSYERVTAEDLAARVAAATG